MLDGPLGGAAFNNEFGRPNLRRLLPQLRARRADGLVRAYDKPIMLAGGLGAIDRGQVDKLRCAGRCGDRARRPGDADRPGRRRGQFGGLRRERRRPRFRLSVQRDNPEMERRCQEVIDRCVAMGERQSDPVFHDVGAGGLSNAIPELLHDSGVGGVIDLGKVPSDDPSLSPMQLWCNESQERYVLGVAQARLAEFAAICARERCPFAVVGTATRKSAWWSATGARGWRHPRPSGRRLRSTCRWTCCSARRRRCTATRASAGAALAGAGPTARSTCARPACACSRIRPWRRRTSWSPSATAASAA
jgi:phosphoribosylformylglycinamidine synthase